MTFNVSIERDTNCPQIAVITIDNPPVNAMSPGVPGSVIGRLKEAVQHKAVLGILLTAGGKGGLAGADIKMQGQTWPEGEPRFRDMVTAVDECSKPVAILLRRHALGGGLELALVCRYRIATPHTKVGQPEVKIGIPPGAGGTQRLPRLVGVEVALDMIVSGDPIDVETGLDCGLTDKLVGAADPVTEAAAYLAEQLEKPLRPSVSSIELEAVDDQVFANAKLMAARRYRGQHARQVAIDCVEAATRLPFDEGIAFERARFDECVVSDQAAALRHVFAAERKSARIPGISPDIKTRCIGSAAVLGAGTMGGGIAMCFANAGIPVRVVERDQAALDSGLARVRQIYEASARRGRLSFNDVECRMQLFTTALSLCDVADADIVVEAVFEDMATKKAVFAELAKHAKPGATLATNTSYLDVDEIARAATGRAGDVLGMHFFSPANVMKLLEIVRGRETSPEVLATAMRLGRRLDKTGVVAGVCHGFIGNRLFERYLKQAEFLLEEGASPRQVDTVLVEFGLPMGPFAVRDLAGLDIGWANRKARAHLRKPRERYSRIGDEICERGWFGQKTGRGFYRYGEGSRAPMPDSEVDAIIKRCAQDSGIERRDISAQEILERCLYAVVNEGARVLEEGIALRAGDVDLVWINGYGFPSWRGGPMFWADQVGLKEVLERISAFDRAHDFWSPAPLLETLVKEGKSFTQWDKEPST